MFHNLFEYKNYAWILLLPIVALLIYSAIDLWYWHKSSDAEIIEEILETLPQPANSGRKIAVVSNVDSVEWELLRGYAGISREADIILDPKDLLDLAKKLKTLAKAKPVARLTFFGIGYQIRNKSGGIVGLVENLAAHLGIPNPIEDKVILKFTKQQREINREDFITLRDTIPDLSSAFIAGAQVVFFNCWAGSDTALLIAAGEAFLRHKGGFVIANPKLTKFKISSGGIFWSKESAIITWIDRPGETKWKIIPIEAELK